MFNYFPFSPHTPQCSDITLLLTVVKSKSNKKSSSTAAQQQQYGHFDVLINAPAFGLGGMNHQGCPIEPCSMIPLMVHPTCFHFILVVN